MTHDYGSQRKHGSLPPPLSPAPTGNVAPKFGEGDHRRRKAWFTPQALHIIDEGLAPLREQFGDNTSALTRVALQFCLQKADNAAVLVGFTTPEQVAQNLGSLGAPLTAEELEFVRATAGRLQQRLDEAGEVFLDEKKG